jgi:hypothetical protein
MGARSRYEDGLAFEDLQKLEVVLVSLATIAQGLLFGFDKLSMIIGNAL